MEQEIISDNINTFGTNIPLENDPVSIRTAHINHEASVKSIGILYYLGAIFLSISAIAIPYSDTEPSIGIRIGITVALLGLCAIHILIGTALRRLRRWAKIPTVILSGLGLLKFPIGTLINSYILYLILSQKGQMVFSEEYKSIIEETPNIKYKTPKAAWILLGILVLLLVLMIIPIVI